MRDLRAIAAWIIGEVAAAGRHIREPRLWAALGCGLLLWSLAYQVPYRFQLDIGGDPRTLRQHDDDPYLDNFNAPEPDKLYLKPGAVPFRWARDTSTISIPGLGGGRWSAALKAASGRPDQSAAASHWDDGTTAAPLAVDPQPRIYRFEASADRAGDLTLRIDTPPLTAPGDPRTLGLVLFRLTLEQGAGPHLPAARQLALLALTLALAHLLLRRLAIEPRAALAATLGMAALAAALLATERTALTLIAPRLPLIAAGGYALAIVLAPILTRAARRPSFPLAAGEAAYATGLAVAGLVALALMLRLGGVLHPHARFSDDGLNAHNLMELTQGQVFFTEGLPAESGGGQAPYPPGQYLVFAPAQLVLPTDYDSLKLLLHVANALWDSLTVALLWYLLRRGGAGRRAALLGAGLYLLPPPLLASLSVGEFANIFGQGMAVLLLATLALWAGGWLEVLLTKDEGRTKGARLSSVLRPSSAGASLGPDWRIPAVLALPFLSHLGVTISLICVLAWLVPIWLLRPERRPAAAALVAGGLAVAVLLAVFYYSALADTLAARIGAAPSAAAAAPLAQKLATQLSLARKLGIQPLLVALGALGALLVGRHKTIPPRPAVGALLGAWWGGTLISLGLLVFASQGVRWQAFFYPALCLGGGPALDRIWPRGRAGRIVALGLLGFLIWFGLAYWVNQIETYSP